ncbi:MAG TPA: hypothetical protein ENI23_02530 [bacterium]|nr:hypothetical protein [bacterium]
MKFSSILEKIDDEYRMSLDLVGKYEDGFRNSVFKLLDKKTEKNYVLIVYKRESGIQQTINNAHLVAKFLSLKGFPTRIPIKTDKGKEKVNFKERYLALYNFLPGETIPWEAYTKKHLKAIGKTLSNLHFELREYKEVENLTLWRDLVAGEVKGMKKYFREVEQWIVKKLGIRNEELRIRKIFDFVMELDSNRAQALHYDFVRGNILFSDRVLKDNTYEITGLIDFEKVCLGPPVADTARTLSFLLVDTKFKDEKEVVKYFLDKGYNKRGNNKLQITNDKLKMLISYFWLRDFWKFLLHNPYEDLYSNEHYLRTVEKLLEKGVLTKVS